MAEALLSIVGTPIGNLGEMSFRAIETLKSADVIFCEDTRHSLKLLNHFEIKKKLKSAPYFKERKMAQQMLESLGLGQHIAYISDAGMPGLSDPGAILVEVAREQGFKIEVIGGPSALTSFIAGLGRDLQSFRFVGFLPPKKEARKRLFLEQVLEPTIFFESPHRIQRTLELLSEAAPSRRLSLAKELSKISENFFEGLPGDLMKSIPSWKGEWVGLMWPDKD